MKGDEITVIASAGHTFRVTEEDRAECRSCGAPILWCITARGKKTPVDMRDDDGPTTSHFATCPDGAARRKM